MRCLRVLSWATAVFVITGCAGRASAPEGAHGGPCLPTAVTSQFFFWPVVAFRTVSLLTEDGDSAPATWVVYRKGKASVAAMWVHSDLIAVDPSPETDDPEWVDLSLVVPVDGKLVLRRSPEAPCRWERWETDQNALWRDPLKRIRVTLLPSAAKRDHVA